MPECGGAVRRDPARVWNAAGVKAGRERRLAIDGLRKCGWRRRDSDVEKHCDRDARAKAVDSCACDASLGGSALRSAPAFMLTEGTFIRPPSGTASSSWGAGWKRRPGSVLKERNPATGCKESKNQKEGAKRGWERKISTTVLGDTVITRGIYSWMRCKLVLLARVSS